MPITPVRDGTGQNRPPKRKMNQAFMLHLINKYDLKRQKQESMPQKPRILYDLGDKVPPEIFDYLISSSKISHLITFRGISKPFRNTIDETVQVRLGIPSTTYNELLRAMAAFDFLMRYGYQSNDDSEALTLEQKIKFFTGSLPMLLEEKRFAEKTFAWMLYDVWCKMAKIDTKASEISLTDDKFPFFLEQKGLIASTFGINFQEKYLSGTITSRFGISFSGVFENKNFKLKPLKGGVYRVVDEDAHQYKRWSNMCLDEDFQFMQSTGASFELAKIEGGAIKESKKWDGVTIEPGDSIVGTKDITYTKTLFGRNGEERMVFCYTKVDVGKNGVLEPSSGVDVKIEINAQDERRYEIQTYNGVNISPDGQIMPTTRASKTRRIFKDELETCNITYTHVNLGDGGIIIASPKATVSFCSFNHGIKNKTYVFKEVNVGEGGLIMETTDTQLRLKEHDNVGKLEKETVWTGINIDQFATEHTRIYGKVKMQRGTMLEKRFFDDSRLYETVCFKNVEIDNNGEIKGSFGATVVKTRYDESSKIIQSVSRYENVDIQSNTCEIVQTTNSKCETTNFSDGRLPDHEIISRNVISL